MERHFEGKQEARLYKRYRSCTPPIVVDKILNYVREKYQGPLSSMVDVGCGNGQNTLVFAPYFQKVLGTDVSPNMIAEVANDPSIPANVSFGVSPAENLPVPDGSLDLVTGAQCFHWFDHDQFHREMRRVLKPNGVVAMIGHELEILADPLNDKKSSELHDVIVEYFTELSPYFQKGITLLIDCYSGLPFPYEDVSREVKIRCDCPATLADYLGLMNTYSPFQRWCREQPEVAMAARDKLTKGLAKVLQVEDGTPFENVPTTLRLEKFLLMGRIKSTTQQ